MWFKKKAQISGFNANTAVNGIDWRTNEGYSSWSASNTLPSAADAGNYFYLPASGYYLSGQLSSVGGFGYYWSSSAFPRYSGFAYHLYFGSGNVYVYSGYRYDGFRAEAFQ